MERMGSRGSGAIPYSISRIVKTKQLTRRWHKLATVPTKVTGIMHALSMRFSYQREENERSRDSENTSGGVPRDVPEGHLAVYAGKEEELPERFVIPVAYLNHALFLKLLQNAEEEFAFNYRNGHLTIPCDPAVLASIINVVRGNGNHHRGMDTVDSGYRLA